MGNMCEMCCQCRREPGGSKSPGNWKLLTASPNQEYTAIAELHQPKKKGRTDMKVEKEPAKQSKLHADVIVGEIQQSCRDEPRSSKGDVNTENIDGDNKMREFDELSKPFQNRERTELWEEKSKANSDWIDGEDSLLHRDHPSPLPVQDKINTSFLVGEDKRTKNLLKTEEKIPVFDNGLYRPDINVTLSFSASDLKADIPNNLGEHSSKGFSLDSEPLFISAGNIVSPLATTSGHKYDSLVERGLTLNALSSIMDEYYKLNGKKLAPDLLEKELVQYINLEFYGAEKQKENVGTVNIYVCSSAEQDIGELIECLSGWRAEWEKKDSKKHMTFYFYVDRFCAPAGQKTNLEAQNCLLQKARMVLIVLPTWENFDWVMEAECILVVAIVSQMSGTLLDITFPRDQQSEFEKACGDHSKFTNLVEQLQMVNYEQAVEDLNESEDKRYHDYIKDSQKINMVLHKVLRSWLFNSVKEIAEKILQFKLVGKASAGEIDEKKEIMDESSSLLHVAGLSTRETGDFNQSVTFLSRAWELANDQKSCDVLRFELALSLTEKKEHSQAEKIMAELLKSPDALSEERREEAELTFVKCLVARGDFNQARIILKTIQPASSMEDHNILINLAMVILADMDSIERKYADAERLFQKAIKPLEHPTPTTTDATYSNGLNQLKFIEHLLRKAADETLPYEEHQRAMSVAREFATKLRYLPTIFSYVKGERHPDSLKAADMLLDLHRIVDPKQFQERWLNLNYGMERAWSKTPERGVDSIVVMHWNILADALAFGDLVKEGFSCDDSVLNWQKCRKDKVISQIVNFDPDVVGLVEIDHYDDILSILSRFGYEGVWLKKNRDFYKDGGAIFWKRTRLKKVDELLTPLKKKDKFADQVFVSVKLAPLAHEKKTFAVGCIHLKSTKKAKGEQVRLDQAKQVLDLFEQNYAKIPRILLADLNSESADNVTRDYEPKAHPYIISSVFLSAYKQALGAEPNFTSWKRRAKDEFKYTVDFVFHSKEIKSKAVLLLPNEDQFDHKILLPSMNNPSDHLPLVTELGMPWGFKT